MFRYIPSICECMTQPFHPVTAKHDTNDSPKRSFSTMTNQIINLFSTFYATIALVSAESFKWSLPFIFHFPRVHSVLRLYCSKLRTRLLTQCFCSIVFLFKFIGLFSNYYCWLFFVIFHFHYCIFFCKIYWMEPSKSEQFVVLFENKKKSIAGVMKTNANSENFQLITCAWQKRVGKERGRAQLTSEMKQSLLIH